MGQSEGIEVSKDALCATALGDVHCRGRITGCSLAVRVGPWPEGEYFHDVIDYSCL